MTIGDRIRLARERVGLTQRELAREAGLSQSTISRVEAGTHAGPAVTEVHRVAVATGTTLRHLLRGDRSSIRTAARVAATGDPDADSRAALAHHWTEVNALHPFREGNTRAQAVFFTQLAVVAARPLDWTRVDHEAFVRARHASMTGPDAAPLAAVLDRAVG